jgi:L-lactate dehydrogenase complex protein LldG
MSTSRDKILSGIRKTREKRFVSANEVKPKSSSQFFEKEDLPLSGIFIRELTAISGEAFLFENESELSAWLKNRIIEKDWPSIFIKDEGLINLLSEFDIPLRTDNESFQSMEAAITGCLYLVARFGSVVVSSANAGGRQLNVFPPVHIIIARESQLVYELSDALDIIRNISDVNDLPSLLSLVTGPSRTADIEKTLILGAHGPRELIVLILKN